MSDPPSAVRGDRPRRSAAVASALVSGVAAGAVAGAAALALDLLLVRWMVGYGLHVEPRHAAIYLATGALLGLLWMGLRPVPGRIFRRGDVSPGDADPLRWPALAAGVLVLLYAVAAGERLAHLLRVECEGLVAVAVVVALAAGLGASRLASRLARSRIVGPLALAGVLAGGLAVHRNAVLSDFSLRALGLDLLLLAMAAGLLVAARRDLGGAARWAGIVVSVATLAVLAVSTRADLAPPVPAERSVAGDAVADGRRDLFLIVIDTLRRDVFEEVLETTPEGRALRDHFAGGVYFERAVAVAPWTAPSVGSMFTGLYPREHGFGTSSDRRGQPLRRLDPAVPTLAERLERRGWATWAWVSNPILLPASGISRGFGHFHVLQPPTTRLPLLTALVRLGAMEAELYQGAREVRRAVEQALPRLRRQRAEGRPVFAWIHFMDPHAPLRRHAGLTPPPDAGLAEKDALYRGEVRFALGQLATLLGRLESAGLWHDAAAVLVSDHGEMFPSDAHDARVTTESGEPKTYGHGHALYDELVGVPLIVRPPGATTETAASETAVGELFRSAAVVSHVDLPGTLAELAGAEIPAAGPDRISLLPATEEALRGGEIGDGHGRPWALASWCQQGPRKRALVSGRYKVLDLGPDGAELYDLAADPREERDLAAAEPERLDEGLRLLRACWAGLRRGEATEDVELDAETRRRLEALGYL